jgi:hypothetical protein
MPSVELSRGTSGLKQDWRNHINGHARPFNHRIFNVQTKVPILIDINMWNLPLASAALQHKKRRIVDQDPYYHTLAEDVCTLSEPAITKVSDYPNISNNMKTAIVWHESKIACCLTAKKSMLCKRETYSSKYCNSFVTCTCIFWIWLPPPLPYPPYTEFWHKLNLQS